MENVKVEITGGHVEIKPCVSRKNNREYRKKLFANSKRQGESYDINLIEADSAAEWLILRQLEKIVINGEEKEIKVEILDEMDSRDYARIEKALTAMMKEQEEEKKD